MSREPRWGVIRLNRKIELGLGPKEGRRYTDSVAGGRLLRSCCTIINCAKMAQRGTRDRTILLQIHVPRQQVCHKSFSTRHTCPIICSHFGCVLRVFHNSFNCTDTCLCLVSNSQKKFLSSFLRKLYGSSVIRFSHRAESLFTFTTPLSHSNILIFICPVSHLVRSH
jgi:hypothetical protein